MNISDVGSSVTINTNGFGEKTAIDSYPSCYYFERDALPCHGPTASEPIKCPQPQMEDIYIESAYEEEVEHYNQLTWAMYFRIMNARQVSGAGDIAKKTATKSIRMASRGTMAEEKKEDFNTSESSDLIDEVFCFEM